MNKLLSVLVLVMVVSGCADNRPSAPQVKLVYQPGLTESDMEYFQAGVHAWSELGFELVEESDLPKCPQHWYDEGITDCLITITVELQPIESDGVEYAGWADRPNRRVILNSRLNTRSYAAIMEFWATAAHEIGHVLLNSGHLEDGQKGILSSPYNMGDDNGTTPTQADFDRACEVLHICIKAE
jgi:hypothetical protein